MESKIKLTFSIDAAPPTLQEIIKTSNIEFSNEAFISFSMIDKKLSLSIDGHNFNPINISFKSSYKINKNDNLAKAIGRPSTLLDATLGMCKDASLFLSLGIKVYGLEKSKIISLLIYDAIRRERPNNFIFFNQNAIEFLKTNDQKFDVIYLDPMYEEVGNKKSLPNKEMQIFRMILENDSSNLQELLDLSFANAKDRVVIKRPSNAPYLVANPTHSYQGKSTRFDMYKC